jgi:hypothetical protein
VTLAAARGVAAASCLLLLAAGCGGSSHHSRAAAKRQRPRRLTVRRIGSLGDPVQDAAAAPVGGDGAVLLGGLTAADVSRPDILRLSGGRVAHRGSLPTPLHDAAAVTLGGKVYLLGGQGDGILEVDPRSARVSQAGRLSQGLSDIAAGVLGRTIYVVGGFTGQQAVDTILAWRPGGAARIVARLPSPIRYAAVAPLRGRLLIVGGSTPAGATRAVLSFDPRRRKIRTVARLPRPLTHAAAVRLGSAVYVLGGRGDRPGTPTNRIWSIDEHGTVARAGRLPEPLSDLGAVPEQGRVLVAGGRTRHRAVSGIWEASR